MLFYVICVFCRLVVLVRLSVPVQVIVWKDLSPKLGTLSYSLTTLEFLSIYAYTLSHNYQH